MHEAEVDRFELHGQRPGLEGVVLDRDSLALRPGIYIHRGSTPRSNDWHPPSITIQVGGGMEVMEVSWVHTTTEKVPLDLRNL